MAFPLLAIHFSEAISLGSIIVGVLVGLAGLFVFVYGARWKAAYEAEHAVADSLKDGREAFQMRAERVEEELKQSIAQREESLRLIAEQKETIAKLEELSNVARILETIKEMGKQDTELAEQRVMLAVKSIEEFVHDEVHTHDVRAQDRHDRQLTVMSAIERRLNDGGSK